MSKLDHSRRHFLKTVAAGSTVAVTGIGLTGCNLADIVSFSHGVASGDPLADRVIIWSRLTPQFPAHYPINWQVATDRRFANIVKSGSVTAGAERDYTIKVDVDGLMPATEYYYRFEFFGKTSAVGKTKTLPVGDVSSVRMAVFSCSNYPAGYFNVYREAALRDDLDAVLHLGDYIYEYEKDGYASEDALSLGRVSVPAHELRTLDDYRKRYAQYRSDSDLQALHAKVPFIVVWDDHEISNDTYKDGAENHDPMTEGEFYVRRSAAIQAFYEWLPLREQDAQQPERIYRSFDFGNLLSLHMLDTRVIGRDKQLDYAGYFDTQTGAFDGAGFQADLGDVNRQLLGAEQTQWLQSQMAASNAQWQILGQQVLMGRMDIPAPLVTQQISFSDYTSLLIKGQAASAELSPQEQAILAQPAIPYNLDAWDGYFVARETVLQTALQLDKNLIVLSGDTHNAWANDLKDMHGNQAGVEFATSSVSSPGLEDYFPNEQPDAVAAGLTQMIEPLKFANTELRGYMLLTVTPESAQADWHFVDTVKSGQYSMVTGKSKMLRVLPGAGNRAIVEG